ncbi:MAG: histidine kinase [Saprospiraceae bacterium]
MGNKWISLLCVCLLLTTGVELYAQQLAFRQLGNGQGINSLPAWNCAIDKYGFFWIATSDGLVWFNGKETTYFFHQTYPEIPSDQIGFVYCDSRNYIWVCTDYGLVRINDEQKFQRQVIVEKDTAADVSLCFESGDGDMYAQTSDGMYSQKKNEEKWIHQSWMDSLIAHRRVREVRRFDHDRILMLLPSAGVLLVNTKTNKQDAFFNVRGVNCVAKFNERSILIGRSGSFGLLYADIHQPDQINTIPGPSFFHKKNVHEQIIYMVRSPDHNVYMTTEGEGLLRIDSTLSSYTLFVHDPVNPSTVINNSLRYITTDSSGVLVITSLDGVIYSNVMNNAVEYINYEQTEDGNLIDERVISIAEDKNKKLWICTKEHILLYDPQLKRAQQIIIPVAIKEDSTTHYPMYVERDEHDNMWVALRQEGIAIFSPEGKFKKIISGADFPGFGRIFNSTRIIREGHDGFMYVGTERGIFRISHDGLKLDTFGQFRGLAPLRDERIVDILLADNSLWVSTSPNGAAWRYSFSENKLDTFTLRKGMPSNRVYRLTADKNGNIYIGSRNGLTIIHREDSLFNLTKGQGLVSDRIETIESADDGNIWMTNSYALLKYNPVTGEVFKLGGRQGLSNANFAIMASAKLSDGKLAFGVSKGLIIVDPSTIRFDEDSLNVFVFYRNTEGREIQWPPGQKIYFNYKQNNIQFTFATSDIMIADQVLYKYRLSSGGEGHWSVPTLNSAIDFNLNPGNYSLEVEAFDGHTWYNHASPLQFKINSPWWKQWWFLALLFILVATVLWIYFRGRIEKFRKELLITRQISDLESKALRAQMNPHFVFNSLNAIQECIVTGRVEEAYTYLSTFSKLLRMVLEHSDVPEVTLQEELEVFSLYISLEKLRFKDEMTYTLHLDSDLDAEEILIPPMLIQPHLENAIWHGLRHKDGDKHLKVIIKEKPNGYLEVIVEDDGIGRIKATAMREARLGGNKHRPKGKQLSENRMLLLKNAYPATSMNITDLYDKNGEASGTKVILIIPMLKKSIGTIK